MKPFVPPASTLFCPADRPELAAKAARSAAVAVCLDLEDGVAPAAKPAARDNLKAAAEAVAAAGKPVFVRINSDLDLVSQDLAALPDGCAGVVMPKTRGLSHVDQLGEALDRVCAGRDMDPGIVCLVEDAASIAELRAGRARGPHPRLGALCIGGEDLAADLGCESAARIIVSAFDESGLAARAMGVALLGYPDSIANFRDLARFEEGARKGLEAGAEGGFCIHPAQAEVLNRVFTPSAARVAWAEKVVAAFEEAVAKGAGAISVDGGMVDRPVYERAAAVLKRARR